MASRVVLVVEDEPNIQETFAIVLKLEGFEALIAANVDEALAMFGRDDIDAITLDVRMPDPKGLGRDGLTLLRFLRTIPAYHTVPVLMFTGADLTLDDEALIASLGAKVFHKPMAYDDIVEELNRRLSTSFT